jgi:xylulokinase
VAYNLRMIMDALTEQGARIRAMRLIGGGAKSPVWRQILADVLGLPIARPRLLAEATSLGAALAGGVAVGIWPGYEVASELVRAERAERPEPESARAYKAAYPLFKDAYRALEPIFSRLAELP